MSRDGEMFRVWSWRFGRLAERRRIELLVTGALFVLALAVMQSGAKPEGSSSTPSLAEKLSYAMIVALIIRWVMVLFAEVEPRVDVYSSSYVEYHEAIRSAKHRIWILQTWLPGVESAAEEILDSDASNKRILLGSFKDGMGATGKISSPLYARIAGRGISVDEAQSHVWNSCKRFFERGKTSYLRFNFGHHPGWIAVVDWRVFWGPTPVHLDNQSKPSFFHVDSASGEKGRILIEQFDHLWDDIGRHGPHVHDYQAERVYNPHLK